MDQKLLFLINSRWTSPALDSFMATMSCMAAWAPLLAVAGILLAVKGGFKARAMLVALGIVIAMMDMGVSDTIKKIVHRARPRESMEGVRVVDLQPGMLRFLSVFKPAAVYLSAPPPANPTGHSFPSGHTINTFGAATVLTLFYKRRGLLAFIPAVLVGYSRIYVGAHWPSDVLTTAFIGIGATLLLMAALDLAWRKFGGSLMPGVFANHPALLEEAAA
jgi:undecaprenyl-diphosphatase